MPQDPGLLSSAQLAARLASNVFKVVVATEGLDRTVRIPEPFCVDEITHQWNYYGLW